MATDNDIMRLPKWAQQQIHQLEQKLGEALDQRDMAFAAVNGGAKSPVYVDGHLTRPNIYLPDMDVTFAIDKNNYISARLQHHYKTGEPTGVQIRTNWSQLVAKPEAANTLFIGVERN